MTAIRTPDRRLRIFISSTMKELADARASSLNVDQIVALTSAQ
jgi:hypothetical protein